MHPMKSYAALPLRYRICVRIGAGLIWAGLILHAHLLVMVGAMLAGFDEVKR